MQMLFKNIIFKIITITIIIITNKNNYALYKTNVLLLLFSSSVIYNKTFII